MSKFFWTENKSSCACVQLNSAAVPDCWFCFRMNKLQPQFLRFFFHFFLLYQQLSTTITTSSYNIYTLH